MKPLTKFLLWKAVKVVTSPLWAIPVGIFWVSAWIALLFVETYLGWIDEFERNERQLSFILWHELRTGKWHR